MRLAIYTVHVIVLAIFGAATGYGETLVIGQNNWCPHVCVPAGQASGKGYTRDIISRILKRAGYKVETVNAPFKRLVRHAEKGLIDILPSICKEEAPFMLFAETPTGMAEELFFVKQGNRWRYNGIPSLKKAGIIGLIKGAGYNNMEFMQYVSDNPDQFHVLAGRNIVPRQIRMLISGRFQTFIGDRFVVHYFAGTIDARNRIREANALSSRNPLYAGISPETPKAAELAVVISEGVKYLRRTGELSIIMKSYDLEDWETP